MIFVNYKNVHTYDVWSFCSLQYDSELDEDKDVITLFSTLAHLLIKFVTEVLSLKWKLLFWFENGLLDRREWVVISGCKSQRIFIRNGVPQDLLSNHSTFIILLYCYSNTIYQLSGETTLRHNRINLHCRYEERHLLKRKKLLIIKMQKRRMYVISNQLNQMWNYIIMISFFTQFNSSSTEFQQ